MKRKRIPRLLDRFRNARAFVVALPRSGGDYVFVSRSLSPILGFVGNFSYGILLLLFVAITGVTVSTTGIATLFGYLGVIESNSGLLGIATALSNPGWIFVIGIIWIIGTGIMTSMSTRLYVRLQNATFVFVLLGALIMLFALLGTTHTSFVSAFNNFASQYTGRAGDYYSNVTTTAINAGWSAPDTTSLYLGVVLFPVFATSSFFNWNAQLAGEIRNPRRSALIAQLGGAVIFFGLLVTTLVLLYNVAGFNFLSSIDYLLYNSPSQIPLPALPYAGLLISISTNPVLAFIIILSAIVQLTMYMPTAFIYASRGLLAYSFDGVVPSWFAEVSDRTHGPVNSVLTAVVISCIFFIIVNIPLSSAYVYLLSTVTTWWAAIFPSFIVALSALVIRRRKPQIYELFPIKGAALSILAVITMAVMALIVYLELSNPIYGANSPLAIGIVLGTTIVLGAIYAIAHFQRGDQLKLVYSEIPPE